MIIKAPITAVWAITKIAGKQWQWSLAVGVAVAILVAGILVIMLLVVNKFRKLQVLTDSLNQVTSENLSGIRIIRAYNAEGYQKNKFESVNEEFTNTNLFTGRVMAFMNPLMSLVMNGISLAIYWIGAYIISESSMMEFAGLFGDMVVFMSYGMQIIMAFMMLAMMFMIAPRSLVSAKRINEVLETEELIEEGNGVGATKETGTVEFKDVYFRYPDGNENVLSDISFKVNKGDTVAFIGSTGCGKSSVVNLVSRFYDVTGGEVLVDGVNVKEYRKNELEKKIGYVSQKAVMFSGDIRSNVNFGDNNADDSIASLIGFIAMGLIMAKSQKHFVARQNSLAAVNGHVEEYYAGQNIVRAYNSEEKGLAVFKEANEKLRKHTFKAEFLSGLMMPIMSFVGNFGYVAVCIVGAALAFNGTINFSVVVAFMIYIRLFTSPLGQIGQGFSSIQSALAASERVAEFLEEELEDESAKRKELTNVIALTACSSFTAIHNCCDGK